ncbi:MAG: dUTP diphosphatase [Alphaproteobacteria bacterium]
MNKVTVSIKRLPHSEGLDLPFYATTDSAGMDLYAAVENDVVIKSGERALIPTGLCFGIPSGYEVQIRPRSGLALKNGISLVNTPGTIDADYRGEIGIILINHGAEDFVVERGLRVAQAVLAPVWQIQWNEADNLDATERGEGGFGSTGVKKG